MTTVFFILIQLYCRTWKTWSIYFYHEGV